MDLFETLKIILDLVKKSIPLVIAFAVLYFLWGARKYITAIDGDDQKEAKDMIVHGIIILFVMVSVWGLVNLIVSTFGVGPTNLPPQQIRIGNFGNGGGTSGGAIFQWSNKNQ